MEAGDTADLTKAQQSLIKSLLLACGDGKPAPDMHSTNTKKDDSEAVAVNVLVLVKLHGPGLVAASESAVEPIKLQPNYRKIFDECEAAVEKVLDGKVDANRNCPDVLAALIETIVRNASLPCDLMALARAVVGGMKPELFEGVELKRVAQVSTLRSSYFLTVLKELMTEDPEEESGCILGEMFSTCKDGKKTRGNLKHLVTSLSDRKVLLEFHGLDDALLAANANVDKQVEIWVYFVGKLAATEPPEKVVKNAKARISPGTSDASSSGSNAVVKAERSSQHTRERENHHELLCLRRHQSAQRTRQFWPQLGSCFHHSSGLLQYVYSEDDHGLHRGQAFWFCLCSRVCQHLQDAFH